MNREEPRSPQRVLFDLAIANPMMVDQMLDVLFEAIADDLSEDVKLDWHTESGKARTSFVHSSTQCPWIPIVSILVFSCVLGEQNISSSGWDFVSKDRQRRQRKLHPTFCGIRASKQGEALYICQKIEFFLFLCLPLVHSSTMQMKCRCKF